MGFSRKNRKIEPRCEYCVYASVPGDREEALCLKEGIMEPHNSCKKFKYDPLKRIPRKITFHSDFTEDDFKL